MVDRAGSGELGGRTVLAVTFSVVARVGPAYGVAVASKFLAVGTVVPAARIGVGAVATQSFAKVSFKADGLALLADGVSAAEAARRLLASDLGREERQLGIVGARDAATFTGSGCMAWAGGVCGSDPEADEAYAIQGNILTGPEVVAEMERAWLGSSGLPFERRLLAALLAGDAAGGDRRGRQGAAVYAVAPGAGYDGCGVVSDLRVDDHPDATRELARLQDLSDLYFGHPEDVSPLTGALADEVRALLAAAGYSVAAGAEAAGAEAEAAGAAALDEALGQWAGVENLELRLVPGGIDARVLAYLRALPEQGRLQRP